MPHEPLHSGDDMTAQIENEPALLFQMMDDLAAYRGELGPGPYWRDNQQATVSWLQKNDLDGFRRYEADSKALSNFGGGSRWPNYRDLANELRALDRSPVHRTATKLGIGIVTSHYRRGVRARARELHAQRMIANLLAQNVVQRDTADELSNLAMAPVGDPSDLIDIAGRHYTPKFLDEFLKYIEMKDEIDFARVKTVVEIGPGVGTFAELMAKLDTTRRLYLIDIPPQLYVLEKVLSAIFPGEVLGYRESKQTPARLSEKDWRIAILAPWQAEDLQITNADLAFNQVSFSEMQRTTVLAYLSLLDRWNVRQICLRAADQAKTDEGPGAQDYIDGLANYGLAARHPIATSARGLPASAPSGSDARTASVFFFQRRSSTQSGTQELGSDDASKTGLSSERTQPCHP